MHTLGMGNGSHFRWMVSCTLARHHDILGDRAIQRFRLDVRVEKD